MMLLKSIVIAVVSLSSAAFAKTAFQRQVGDNRQIAVSDDAGGNVQIISKEGVDTYHPEMSPSGDSVAYSRGVIRPGAETMVELVVKSLVDQSVEIWTERSNQNIHAEFSGNGRYLVFSGPHPETGKQNIMVIDLVKERAKGPVKVETVDGVVEKTFAPVYEVIESDFDCFAPAVSSDGDTIIYHRTKNKNDKRAPKQLISYSRSGEQKTELTELSAHAIFPTLSADDRHLAYASKDGGQWDLYIRDLWLKKTRKLTDDPNVEFTPSFSSDGDLYYTKFSTDGDEQQIDIFKINKDQVLDPKKSAASEAFLNEKNVAEYAISFSKNFKLSVRQGVSFSEPARSSFGSVYYKDKIYIAGGHQGPEHTYPEESFLNNLEVYDMKTKVWSSLPSMKIPKQGFQMVAFEGHLYVFGGFAFGKENSPNWKSLDTVERYSIEKGVWEVLPVKLSVPRSSNALAQVGTKVYLIGGWNGTPKSPGDKNGEFLRQVDVFDLASETLVESSLKLPNPLRRALSAVAVKEKIYLLGGIGEGASHFEWVDNLTELDTSTQTWTELPPLPFATFAPGAGAIGQDLFLIGGMVLHNKETFDLNYVDDVYRYNLSNQKWSHTGSYVERNKGFPQVVPLPENKLGVLGGHTYELTPKGWRDHPVKSFEVLELIKE